MMSDLLNIAVRLGAEQQGSVDGGPQGLQSLTVATQVGYGDRVDMDLVVGVWKVTVRRQRDVEDPVDMAEARNVLEIDERRVRNVHDTAVGFNAPGQVGVAHTPESFKWWHQHLAAPADHARPLGSSSNSTGGL